MMTRECNTCFLQSTEPTFKSKLDYNIWEEVENFGYFTFHHLKVHFDFLKHSAKLTAFCLFYEMYINLTIFFFRVEKGIVIIYWTVW